METLTKKQLERLAFVEIQWCKKTIKELKLSNEDVEPIKERMRNKYDFLRSVAIKDFLDFAPTLRKVSQAYLEGLITEKLESFDYKLGMSFFNYSQKFVFRNATPIKFIQNTKRAICIQISTRFSSCLFDIGLNPQSMKKMDCNNIDYVFITHEHFDHCSGLEFYPQNTKTIFVVSSATQNIIFKKIPSAKNLKWQTFNTGEPFYLNGMKIDTLEVKHDCYENLAYKIDDGILKTVYLIDLGKWTDKEVEFCNDADRILIESYYDEDTPRSSSPLEIRRRSSYGHLSMQSANEFIKKLEPKLDREVYFCHNEEIMEKFNNSCI